MEAYLARTRAAGRERGDPSTRALSRIVLRLAGGQQGGRRDRRGARGARLRPVPPARRTRRRSRGGRQWRTRDWPTSASARCSATAASARSRARRAPPAPTVGFDQHQESSLLRHPVRGRADRTRHREHHAARDASGVQRSRRGGEPHRAGSGCRARAVPPAAGAGRAAGRADRAARRPRASRRSPSPTTRCSRRSRRAAPRSPERGRHDPVLAGRAHAGD